MKKASITAIFMNNGPFFSRKLLVFFIQTILLASIVFGLEWLLLRQGITLWIRDIIFTLLLLLFWLGRKWPPMFIVALILFVWLITAQLQAPYLITWRVVGILLSCLMGLLYWARKNSAAHTAPPQKRRVRPLRILLALAIAGAVIWSQIGPIAYLVNPEKAKSYLLTKAEMPPPPLPQDLLASRLKEHVDTLSVQIGKRAIYQLPALDRAGDYIRGHFVSQGLATRLLDYKLAGYPDRMGQVKNIEAVLSSPHGASKPVWIIGAHYDAAPGTPGADDNASAVAVLMELAPLLKNKNLSADIRFVAFVAEEPPNFGTQNMGSYHYAQSLKQEGIPVAGMICLEMLGYFSDRPGSQLYPPFLARWYPDRGNFVALAGNVGSRGLVRSFKEAWNSNPSFPLETIIFPGPLSAIALSDQLNFWDQGFSAVMLSDTAFLRNPYYHEATDCIETLNFSKMSQITQSLARTLINILTR
jgi:hypothetical protein